MDDEIRIPYPSSTAPSVAPVSFKRPEVSSRIRTVIKPMEYWNSLDANNPEDRPEDKNARKTRTNDFKKLLDHLEQSVCVGVIVKDETEAERAVEISPVRLVFASTTRGVQLIYKSATTGKIVKRDQVAWVSMAHETAIGQYTQNRRENVYWIHGIYVEDSLDRIELDWFCTNFAITCEVLQSAAEIFDPVKPVEASGAKLRVRSDARTWFALTVQQLRKFS
ncbi:hypothetical protein E8E12_008858 [Didymella heteroderae]|uniref:Uncharacterized protein n=1 Tax=Didymella heteroderae TaxID=1769908 RepID=A0A9P5C220_9PLEO|nr:hypothetical protein E8E12_008858 [Didymella heteroderae]